MGAEVARRSFLALLAGLAACSDPEETIRNRIDTGWHRDDLDALLLRWHSHAPRPDGSFQAAFDRSWKPRPQTELSLTHQARLVYAFAAGHDIMPDAGYLAIARRGADFMLERFRDAAQGGLFHVISTDGSPTAMRKRPDSHAAALLALSELYRVGSNPRYRDAAEQLTNQVLQNFSDPAGGFYEECNRDFTPVGGVMRTQEPVMRVFEALIALRAASGDKGAEAALRRLGDFIAGKLLQDNPNGGAFIPECYDQNWVPLPTKEAGAYVDLGHQFEWTHLLARGATVSPTYAQLSERMLAYAITAGYDETGGGCGRRAFPDAKSDAAKGWWQQAECLHALLVAAQASSRADLWKRYEQTKLLIKTQLVDAEHGGWHAAETLPCKGGDCRDEQPDPYPIVRLHQAAVRVAQGMPA